MAATAACADAALLQNSTAPRTWQVRPTLVGDTILVVFLLAQCFDGVFTYVGVMSFGVGIEANPLIATLMNTFGHGVGLAGAKLIAAVLGICLHLRQIHSAVAILAAFYIVVAIVPWAMILFA